MRGTSNAVLVTMGYSTKSKRKMRGKALSSRVTRDKLREAARRHALAAKTMSTNAIGAIIHMISRDR